MNTLTKQHDQVRTAGEASIRNLDDLRRIAALRFGKNGQPYMTMLAIAIECDYNQLSDTLRCRRHNLSIIKKLQEVFHLSDAEILACWPLLRRWPRPELEDRAVRRAG